MDTFAPPFRFCNVVFAMIASSYSFPDAASPGKSFGFAIR